MNQNKEKIYAFLLTSLAISASVSFGTSAEAEVNTSKGATIDHGMQGFYFYDTEQKELAYLNENTSTELKPNIDGVKKYLDPQKKVQSAYWSGVLNIKEDGMRLDTSDNKNITLHVSEQGTTDQTNSISNPRIEKGKKYDVSIFWKGEVIPNSLSLSLINERGEKRKLTEKDWFIPKNETEAKQQAEKKMLRSSATPFVIVDSDDDGIPDMLELSGYTVDVNEGDYAVIPWNPLIHENKGLIKYVSSPRKWSTAGDPYSDYQKVTGTLDPSVSEVARNPLVAAYPIITTQIENIILSKNITGITSHGGSSDQTLSYGTSNSITDEVHADVSVSVNQSLFEFGASVTASVGTSHSSTATIDNTNSSSHGTNWSESLQMNDAESAYIGAVVRYKNIGTAPIYQVRPTISMVLGSDQPLVTVAAKENQISNRMSPGTEYPAKGQTGILFNKSDDFSSTPVVINKAQVDLLEKTKKLRMDTLQTDGKIIRLNDAGQPIIQDSPWSMYLQQIEKTTAKVMLEMDEYQYERRIAAVDPSVPLEKTKPEVTLEEALELIYGIQRDNERKFTYKGKEFNFQLILDANSEAEFAKQLENMGNAKDIGKVKLRAKMNVLIKKISLESLKWNGPDIEIMGRDSLEVPAISETMDISLENGYQNYSVESSNPDVLKTVLDQSTPNKLDLIKTGKVGESKVTIRYKLTGNIAKEFIVQTKAYEPLNSLIWNYKPDKKDRELMSTDNLVIPSDYRNSTGAAHIDLKANGLFGLSPYTITSSDTSIIEILPLWGSKKDLVSADLKGKEGTATITIKYKESGEIAKQFTVTVHPPIKYVIYGLTGNLLDLTSTLNVPEKYSNVVLAYADINAREFPKEYLKVTFSDDSFIKEEEPFSPFGQRFWFLKTGRVSVKFEYKDSGTLIKNVNLNVGSK